MTDETSGEPLDVIALPEGSDQTFETPMDAWKASIAEEKKSTAESAQPATAETKLPVEGNADPEKDPGGTEEIEAVDPPIERPKSWSKDEDTEWQSIPRAMQQKIVARETERDTGTLRSQQKAAEAAKAAEAKAAEAEQARQQFLSKIPTIEDIQRFVQQGPFSDIKTQDDADALAAQDPFRYLQWDAYQKRLSGVAIQAQEAQTLKAQEKQSKRSNYEAQQNKLLVELVPEMADAKKASELRDRAVKLLTDDLGLSSDQLGKWMQDDTGHEILANAAIQKLIADGLKYRDILSAPKAAAKPNLPPVQRPGTARAPGAANAEVTKALETKLTNSGALRDAMALYTARQSSRRAS